LEHLDILPVNNCEYTTTFVYLGDFWNNWIFCPSITVDNDDIYFFKRDIWNKKLKTYISFLEIFGTSGCFADNSCGYKTTFTCLGDFWDQKLKHLLFRRFLEPLDVLLTTAVDIRRHPLPPPLHLRGN
jgi:hypothetical protein